jgi:hypothetical protein
MNQTKTKKVRLSRYLKLLLSICLAVHCITTGAQSFDWAKGMGGNSDDQGYRIAVDGNGNVYVTGSFYSGTADFNPGGNGGILTNVGEFDVFLAKYDAGGSFLWAKSMGGSNDDYGYGVAVDGSGNVYVTGYSNSATADFNPGGSGGILTNIGEFDVFVAKYNSAGNFLWAKSMGGNSADQGFGIAVDGSGNVYVTGYFSSVTADFNPGGSGGMLSLAGMPSFDVFLAKYDAGGNFLWAKNMGGSSTDIGYGVTVDGSGNVYATGEFNSATADFNPGGGGGMLTPVGGTDVFLAKYDAGGNFLWAKNMGGSNTDIGYDLTVDGKGNVCMTGRFNSATADFNPGGSGGTLLTAGGIDIFVARYDSGGNFLWAKSMGGSGIDIGYGIAMDNNGDAYVTGYFSSATADFNPGGSGGTLTNNTNTGRSDVFLAKYGVGGSFLWAKSMGGSFNDIGYGVAVDPSGNVYGSGYFSSNTADFNPGGSGGTLTNTTGDYDVFVVKFGCSDTTSSYLTVSLSCGDSYTLNDSVYTAGGIYTQVFPNVSGCDSTVILDLIIMPLDKPVINVANFMLGVTGTYATYQWLLNGEPIPGAEDSAYAVTSNGNYQVAVTNGKGCVDTSDGYLITNYTGIENSNVLVKQIHVYPNPAADMAYVQSPVQVNVTVTDMEGRAIREVKNAREISLKDLAEGIYLLRIIGKDDTLIKVVKLVKQEK